MHAESKREVQRGNGFRLKEGRFRLDIRRTFTVRALAQVAQRCGGCPIPGDTQGPGGWGSEHPDVAVGVPVHCRGVGPDGFYGFLRTQTVQ